MGRAINATSAARCYPSCKPLITRKSQTPAIRIWALLSLNIFVSESNSFCYNSIAYNYIMDRVISHGKVKYKFFKFTREKALKISVKNIIVPLKLNHYKLKVHSFGWQP